MQVLVDTSIWSLALRRHKHRPTEAESELIAMLRSLIQDGRARVIGPIRQELLSGIREPAQFERLRVQLRAFSDEALTVEDYEKAAHLSNECRRRGVAGSGVDFLICAVAMAREWRIFTSDSDFHSYAKVLPLQFHSLSHSNDAD